MINEKCNLNNEIFLMSSDLLAFNCDLMCVRFFAGTVCTNRKCKLSTQPRFCLRPLVLGQDV